MDNALISDSRFRQILSRRNCVLLLLLTFGCSPNEDVLKNMTGVWSANKGGLIFLDLTSEQKRIGTRNKQMAEDAVIPVSIAEKDDVRNYVNLRVTLNKLGVVTWTIRKNTTSPGKESLLTITTHDGFQDQLTFVRPLSESDLVFLNSLTSQLSPTSPAIKSNATVIAAEITGHYESDPGGHPNSSTRGHPKLLHPEQM